MKKILLFTLLGCTKLVNAQIINTVAGNGTNGYSGDGAQAVSAQISYPYAGVFDAAGNMYVIDQGNNAIRKIDASGVITTIAGNGTAGYTGDGGPATAASFHLLEDIAIDGAGNIYVSDCLNNVVRKINTSGIVSTFAGTGTAGFSGDGGPATSAQLNSLNGIRFDALGNLYIADGSNNRIRKVNTSGIITTVAGNGSGITSGDGGPAISAGIPNPFCLVFDSFGNLYATTANGYMRKINTSGIISTYAGNGGSFSGDGGQATAAGIGNVYGMAIDATNNIYLSEYNYSRIRKINTAGIICTIAGTGYFSYGGDGWYATYAYMNSPTGLFFDAAGNLFISDTYNFRVRRVTNVVPDTNEAGIRSITIAPSLVCNDTLVNPIATLENYGTNLLTSCRINYQLDYGAVLTYTWTGSLSTGQTTNINLPTFTITVGNHVIDCNADHPNNAASSTFLLYPEFVFFDIAYAANLPIIEGFETSTCPTGTLSNATWNSFHTATSGTSFQITSNAAASGSKSCMIDNINNVAGNTSVLETVSYYDMTTLTTPLLTFQAAYQQKATTNTDKLQIFTSTDCGNTWVSRKVISSATLASLAGGTGSSPYVPIASQFTTYTVNIAAVAASHNVMFRWEFIADPTAPGNNLYIDNINIVDASSFGIQKIENIVDLKIFPNPANNNITIQSSSELGAITIYNSLGEIVLKLNSKNTNEQIDLSKMPAGVYTLVSQGIYKKLIKE